MTKFKIGDMVKVTVDADEEVQEFVGQVGKVLDVRPHEPAPYEVEFRTGDSMYFWEDELEGMLEQEKVEYFEEWLDDWLSNHVEAEELVNVVKAKRDWAAVRDAALQLSKPIDENVTLTVEAFVKTLTDRAMDDVYEEWVAYKQWAYIAAYAQVMLDREEEAKKQAEEGVLSNLIEAFKNGASIYVGVYMTTFERERYQKGAEDVRGRLQPDYDKKIYWIEVVRPEQIRSILPGGQVEVSGKK